MKIKRLLIAIPTTDFMHADFVNSLIKLTAHLQRDGIAYHVELVAGTLVYLARNKLACKAINEHYSHVLWLDSDMVFNETIVEDLAFCEKEFVCGVFHSRRPPYNSCIFKSIKPAERVKDFGLEAFRVAGCGMACVLVSTDVLSNVQKHFGNCFTPTDDYGEDLAFCWRAISMGAEIWCEPTARVGHIAHVPIWPGEDPAR